MKLPLPLPLHFFHRLPLSSNGKAIFATGICLIVIMSLFYFVVLSPYAAFQILLVSAIVVSFVLFVLAMYYSFYNHFEREAEKNETIR